MILVGIIGFWIMVIAHMDCGRCCYDISKLCDICCAPFKMHERTSSEFYADEFAAAQREHEEKCAALQKQVDDEKKLQSTDGLRITIADSSGKICKRHVGCLVL
jgi:hypothetical protein